jgi:hypothetical protein
VKNRASCSLRRLDQKDGFVGVGENEGASGVCAGASVSDVATTMAERAGFVDKGSSQSTRAEVLGLVWPERLANAVVYLVGHIPVDLTLSDVGATVENKAHTAIIGQPSSGPLLGSS